MEQAVGRSVVRTRSKLDNILMEAVWCVNLQHLQEAERRIDLEVNHHS